MLSQDAPAVHAHTHSCACTLTCFLCFCADPGILMLEPSRGSIWVHAVCCWWLYWGLRMAYKCTMSEPFSLFPPAIRKSIFWACWLSVRSQPDSHGLKHHNCLLLSRGGLSQTLAILRSISSTLPYLSPLALILLHSWSDFPHQVEVESSGEGRVRLEFDLLQAVSYAKGPEERESP